MATIINPTVRRNGDKLRLTYDTDDSSLANSTQVNMSLIRNNGGVRIQFRAMKYKHDSGIIPDRLIGSLEDPVIQVNWGRVEVTYQSDQQIGDIGQYF